jgi:hypothetical protein
MRLAALVVVGPALGDRANRLQLMRAERAIRGAWLRRSISTGEVEVNFYLGT